MLIAVKDNGRVIFGYSNGDSRENMHEADWTSRENVQIWRVKGQPNMLVGAAYAYGCTDAIRYDGSLFKGDITARSLTREVAPLLREKLEKSNFLTKEGFMPLSLAVANGDKLFVINGNFAVIEFDEYAVLGMSRSIAIGALDYVQGSAEDRILAAFRAVESCGGYRRFPVVLCDSMTGKRRIYKG